MQYERGDGRRQGGLPDPRRAQAEEHRHRHGPRARRVPAAGRRQHVRDRRGLPGHRGRRRSCRGKRYGADHDDDVRMRVVADHVRSRAHAHRRRRDARRTRAAATCCAACCAARSARCACSASRTSRCRRCCRLSKDAMSPSYPELAHELRADHARSRTRRRRRSAARSRRARRSSTRPCSREAKQARPRPCSPGVARVPAARHLRLPDRPHARDGGRAGRGRRRDGVPHAHAGAAGPRARGRAGQARRPGRHRGLPGPAQHAEQRSAKPVAVPRLHATRRARVARRRPARRRRARPGGHRARRRRGRARPARRSTPRPAASSPTTGTIVLDGGATHRGRRRAGARSRACPCTTAGWSTARSRFGESGTATIDIDRRRAIARAHTATHLVHKALHESVGRDRDAGRLARTPRAASGSTSARRRRRRRRSLAEIEARVNERLAGRPRGHRLTSCRSTRRAAAARWRCSARSTATRSASSTIGDGWSLRAVRGHARQAVRRARPRHPAGRVVDRLGRAPRRRARRRRRVRVPGQGARARRPALRACSARVPTSCPSGCPRCSPSSRSPRRSSRRCGRRQLLAQAGTLAAGAADAWGRPASSRTTPARSAATSCARSCSTSASRLGEASPAVVAIGGVSKGRPVVVVATNAAARERGVRAGALVRTASGILGGGGGGKDDLAQGGGTDPAGWPRRSRRSPTAVGG